MVDDVVPNEHPTRGWNRASITYWSRKPYRPRLTEKDRELPRGRGPAMLAESALLAILLTISFGWFILFVVGLYRPVPGAVYGAVMGSAVIGLTLFLYGVAAVRGRPVG